ANWTVAASTPIWTRFLRDRPPQQPNSPTAQQPNSPTAQQPNSPTAQQPNSPTAQHLNTTCHAADHPCPLHESHQTSLPPDLSDIAPVETGAPALPPALLADVGYLPT
ncbi:hypothetical protein LOD62_10755, partial [Xylella fastidiosa subsp. multiplex]|uniref:hypothetical protein n=1 Tax=Xylella fastidiosa TaxID=2371 RepID=UPI0023630F8E